MQAAFLVFLMAVVIGVVVLIRRSMSGGQRNRRAQARTDDTASADTSMVTPGLWALGAGNDPALQNVVAPDPEGSHGIGGASAWSGSESGSASSGADSGGGGDSGGSSD